MTKENIHEIICPNCESSFWINDAFGFFNNRQVCSNCKSEIRTGEEGLRQQVVIELKRKAIIRSIRMVHDAKRCSKHNAKKFIKNIARENHLPVNTDVTPVLNFFIRIIISGLLSLALVGIGSIYYPKLQVVAKPIVCDGDFKIEVTEKLTTKEEGERSKGAVIVATCDDEDISKKTFYASIGVYWAGFFILLTIRKFFAKILNKDL